MSRSLAMSLILSAIVIAPQGFSQGLEGRWMQNKCERQTEVNPEGVEEGMETKIQLYFMDQQKIQVTLYYFPLNKCFPGANLQQAEMAVTMSGSYARGASVNSPLGAYALDYKYLKNSITLLEQELVAIYNEERACGFRDWKRGVAKDVTQTECSEIDVGVSIYDIFKNVGGQLQLGQFDEQHDGSSVGMRPIHFDEKLIFEKQ